MAEAVHVGIVGAGVIGLSCALKLTNAGHSVTVLGRNQPGDRSTAWASPWAAAAILPHQTTDELDIQMQIDAFKYYWALAHRDPSSGVQVVNVTEYFDDRDSGSKVWYEELAPRFKHIPRSKLPAGVRCGYTYTSTAISPDYYLPWLKKELMGRGVRFITTTVQSLAEAQALMKTAIVVNASGLGAKELAHDDQVVPIRGQTMLIKSDFDGIVIRRGSEFTYAIPRMFTGGVIIGGIAEEGSTNVQVDQSLKRDILRRVNHITDDAFKDVDLQNVLKDIVGFRPGRTGGVRVEREGNVIHAYGFGGSGYCYSVGVAEKVTSLIKSLLAPRL